MSQTSDEIDDLYKRQELLMEHLGLEFEYNFNEPVGVKKRKPEPAQSPEPVSAKKGRYIDFKEIEAKLKEKNTVEEVNEYEHEIMALDLTQNQKMAICGKFIDRRGVLLCKERYKIR